MAATDPDRAGPIRRRFITRRQVEDAAEAGQVLQVQRRDVVTDEAAQRARDLGVRIERVDRTERVDRAERVDRTHGIAGAPASTEADPDADLRRAVRVAVIAELGEEPHGLDAAIDLVLRRRSG